MSVRCDLHAVDHDLRVEVRGHAPTGRNGLDRPFVVVELHVGDGWVTLFLSPAQAGDLASRIDHCVGRLYGDRAVGRRLAAGEEAQ